MPNFGIFKANYQVFKHEKHWKCFTTIPVFQKYWYCFLNYFKNEIEMNSYTNHDNVFKYLWYHLESILTDITYIHVTCNIILLLDCVKSKKLHPAIQLLLSNCIWTSKVWLKVGTPYQGWQQGFLAEVWFLFQAREF